MGTSAETWFELLQAERLGESIAPDIAFDSTGVATTNPGDALRGAIQAFGGAKGSALALLIEILTGPLTGGAIFGDATHQSGNVVVALDPNIFGYGDSFHERTSSLLENIRSSRPAPGISNPQVPGDHSRNTFKASKLQDRIVLDLSLVESIRAIAEE
jgi:L-2-hydroxycarboxylate dehydrogenase (NAD+)